MPEVEMAMSEILGTELGGKCGRVSSSLVKTDLK